MPPTPSPLWGPPTFRPHRLLAQREENGKANPTTPPPIPLDQLDWHLVIVGTEGRPLQKGEAKRLELNLKFFAQWYPEQLAAAFQQARAALESGGITPHRYYMGLEQAMAPNREAFIEWIEDQMRSWREMLKKETLTPAEEEDLIDGVRLAVGWLPRLTETEQAALRGLFTEVVTLLRRPGFSAGIEYDSMEGLLFASNLRRLSGTTPVHEAPSGPPAEVWALADPEKIYATLDNQGYFFHVPEEEGERVLGLFRKMLAGGPVPRSFWSNLTVFLNSNPGYQERLYEEREAWYAEAAFSNRNQFLSQFMKSCIVDAIWPGRAREAYLFVLAKILPEGRRGPYASLFTPRAGTADIERTLVTEYFRRRLTAGESDPRLDRLTRLALANYLKDLPSLKKLLKKEFPGEAEGWTLGYLMARYLGRAPQPHPHRDLIPLMEAIVAGSPEAPAADPLFVGLWQFSNFGGGELPPIQASTGITRREEVIDRLADQLQVGGDPESVEALKAFYFKHHPYAPIYRLPEGVRPTGKGLAFVSIDSFPNPQRLVHPDKPGARLIAGANPSWREVQPHSMDPIHGFATSALAVGDSLGLAPQAALYIAPVSEQGTNLPRELTEAFERVLAAKEKDPSIRVVGMSLGFETPGNFRAILLESPLYRRLAATIKQLQEKGVMIVLSAGNIPEPGFVNVLGMFPQIRVVGAARSYVTATRKDDAESHYTTQGGADNPIGYWALSDPALHIVHSRHFEWTPQGGTSSAQPHVSGTVLAMLQVNPTLTVDQCDRILRETADPSRTNPQVRLLDPMEAIVAAARLPGSTYQGERLEALAHGLGTISGTPATP